MTFSTYDGVFNKFIFIISCSIILMNDVFYRQEFIKKRKNLIKYKKVLSYTWELLLKYSVANVYADIIYSTRQDLNHFIVFEVKQISRTLTYNSLGLK